MGLTLHATATGKPIASLTLAGYSLFGYGHRARFSQFRYRPASSSSYIYVQETVEPSRFDR